MIELAHGLNRLNFELYAKIREVCADLFQELLYLILIASLEQSGDCERSNRAVWISNERV